MMFTDERQSGKEVCHRKLDREPPWREDRVEPLVQWWYHRQRRQSSTTYVVFLHFPLNAVRPADG